MVISNYDVRMDSSHYRDRTEHIKVVKATSESQNISKEKIELEKKIVTSLLNKISTIKKESYKEENIQSTNSNLFNARRGKLLNLVDFENRNSVIFRQKIDESERVDFRVKGLVETTNGKKIEFDIELKISRKFEGDNSLFVPNLIDPLVINYDSATAKLDKKTFKFDIDSDGYKEQLSMLKSGSGFLALDRDNNGTIDNGSELFGVKSGDGFADLKKFDEDKNGWIDENDSIFDKLRVFRVENSGKKSILALGEVGVGAIFLEKASTEYKIKDEKNRTLGEIKDSGIFLKENGDIGTIQNLDFGIKGSIQKIKIEDIHNINFRDINFEIFDITSLDRVTAESVTRENITENRLANETDTSISTDNREKIEKIEKEELKEESEKEREEIKINIDFSKFQVKSKENSYETSYSNKSSNSDNSKSIEALKSKQQKFKIELNKLEAQLSEIKQLNSQKVSFLKNSIVKTKSEITVLDSYIISLMQQKMQVNLKV